MTLSNVQLELALFPSEWTITLAACVDQCFLLIRGEGENCMEKGAS